MKSLYLIFITIIFASCNSQPKHLSGKIETIEVTYIRWACDCARFLETSYFIDSTYEIEASDCIFIEPASAEIAVPDKFYDAFVDSVLTYPTQQNYYLELTGQFYIDKGVPNSYYVENYKPDDAKVFKYNSFQYIKK